MKIKRYLIIILGLFIITGSVAFAWQKKLLPSSITDLIENIPTKFTEKIPSIDLSSETLTQDLTESLKNADLKSITQDATDQLGTASSRAGELSEHAKNVLGSSVQVNEEEQPLHEKAFEYSQYIYCQQVVKDYEAR